jgi:hypothetical protein
MFGHWREIAKAIAEGFGAGADVQIVGVADADTKLGGFDLVIVGHCTHARSMSWPSTRRGIPDACPGRSAP